MWKKENLRKNFLRVKQIADQNLGRAEKSEVLTEDLLGVEKRVENVKQVTSSITKRVTACLQATGDSVEKRIKKLPETSLAHSLIESATILGNDSLLGNVCQIAGDAQNHLAKEQLQYELNVEKNVLIPLQNVLDNEIPAILKAKKQLTKATLDMDSAKSRYSAAVRQSQVPGTNLANAANKVDNVKEELEDASYKVDQVRDNLSTELAQFISREEEHSLKLLALLQAQADYHEKALEVIKAHIPKLKTTIDDNPAKPVYGTPLEEHLRVAGRDIAVVLEMCILALLEIGMEEEGLFRMAGAAQRVKKLKACFDSHMVDMEDFVQDPHTIAGALKQYLRELPEPLLTFQLFQDFMQAASQPADKRLQALWTVVNKLPKPNFNNLRYLVKFLAKLADKSDKNKMGPSNIAIVIGPNLLWSKNENAPNMLATGTLSAIIEALVTNADWFFPGAIDFHATRRGSTSTPLGSPGVLASGGLSSPPIKPSCPPPSPPGRPSLPPSAAGEGNSLLQPRGATITDAESTGVMEEIRAALEAHSAPGEEEDEAGDVLDLGAEEIDFNATSSSTPPELSNTHAPDAQSDSASNTSASSMPSGVPSSPGTSHSPPSSSSSVSSPTPTPAPAQAPSPASTPNPPPAAAGDREGGSGHNHSGGAAMTASSVTVTLTPAADSSQASDHHSQIQRRVSRKPAPPPPSDRPYSVAVTATVTKANPNQSQTWPRKGAPLASPDSPAEEGADRPQGPGSEVFVERRGAATLDRQHGPPLPEKPQVAHHAPPERPHGPPPARPHGPPPSVPMGHQRSASTGGMLPMGNPPEAPNGQGKSKMLP